MDPTTTLIAAAALTAVLAATAAALASRRRASARLEVVFELRLPSKWAAELTAQTLENTGISPRVMQKGSVWTCYVTKPMGSDRGQIDATCRQLNQIAEARGGGCVAHRIRLGSRHHVFEH